MLFCIPLLAFWSCTNSSSSSRSDNPQPREGELASEFVSEGDTLKAIVMSEEDSLKKLGWEKSIMSNGAMPNCYNYNPRYGDLENKLIVKVGGGTDVVIKVMSLTKGKCIRYVFINSGSTYSIRNLPEDQYYLKIAYGKNWISKTADGMCLGKFMSNALYEKGEEVLDFNKQPTANGYNIPSFSLELDVISNSAIETFNSSGISEEDFNT